MRKNYRTLFFILALLVSITGTTYAENPPVVNEIQSSVSFDFEDCEAFTSNETNQDYSEFQGVVENSPICTQFETNGHLYRDNPEVNTHSCTNGFEDVGMCFSYDTECELNPETDKALKFDIVVNPGPNGSGNISSLSFYEAAPDEYAWIGGSQDVTGPNNPPSLYAVKVLKNGTEIFFSSGLETSAEWSLEEFNFSDNEEFTVTESTTFSFELMAYCMIDNGAVVNAWEIDEINVQSDCAVDGGSLTTEDGETELTICAGDGESDEFDVNLENVNGTNTGWIITDSDANILALPAGPPFDLDGAGPGVCLIWHIAYEGELIGLEEGANAGDLDGCFDLSNAITVNRNEPQGGELIGGPFEFCVGDGEADMIEEGSITLEGNSGANSQWVITDSDGTILGLPGSPYDVNFDGAGDGTCLIWHLSYDGEIEGLEAEANANDLSGCFSLSNPIEVIRNQPEGGQLTGGPFEFCVGDGEADMIEEGAITLEANSGENSQWVITDGDGTILGLPPSPYDVNFDGAGNGTCLIWHLSYDGEIEGLEVEANANDILGCASLSNAIEVIRNQPDGGELIGGPFEFCVGDGGSDMIEDGAITLEGNVGENSQWIITDGDGTILGLPGSPYDVDFDGAGVGVCLVWHLSFSGEVEGLEVDANANDLAGCLNLSNPIEVIRNTPVGGELVGGPFQFCAGDGVEDIIGNDEITLTGNVGANSQLVITDTNGNILGLPNEISDVNFDGAGAGICLIWNLSYDGELEGLEVESSISNIFGCFSLSNAISVQRNQPEGGELIGGPFEFCVGDTMPDMIEEGAITLEGNQGSSSQWVITDTDGTILGLPGSPYDVDFDGAGGGTCLIWHLSHDGALDGVEVDANVENIEGCFNFSNPIEVIRLEGEDCDELCMAEGGELSGGPFEFCVGDGNADMIDDGAITLEGNSGENSQWVITDADGTILGLPGSPYDVDFDGAGNGVCLIWHLSYDGEITGLEVEANAGNLEGCFDLSNPLEVVRNQPDGGELSGGPFEFCVGDDEADMIEEGAITLEGNVGGNSQWVITDANGTILGLPGSPYDVNFDGAGNGVCLIWHLSYDGEITGLAVDSSANNLGGCFSLSNPLEVVRNQPEGGELSGGPFEFCVGDGEADMIEDGAITLEGNSGGNSQWVITDANGTILGLPGSPYDVDFDGAGSGVCLIWHLSYDGEISGLEVDLSANDLEGCFSLSNPLEVNRLEGEDCPEGANIVINEINESNNTIEIWNNGTESADISEYFICTFPDYAMLSSLVIECGGDLILDPDEYVTLELSYDFNEEEGELGLYTTNNFGSSDAIIDYVEWGFAGHTRSDVAVSAGIWTSGDFVNALPIENSLLYDGDGDSSSDWSEGDFSPCTENLLESVVQRASDFKIFPNPASEFTLIKLEQLLSNSNEIIIRDVYGNSLKVIRGQGIESPIVRIALDELQAGYYYIDVIDQTQRMTKAFIKAN